MAVFSQTVSGEDLYLVLSGVEMSGITVNGCRMFDVGETRTIPTEAIAEWIGRAPDRQIDREELVQAAWEPGMLEKQDSFEAFHVPEGSPAIEVTQITGLAFKADQIITSN